MSPIVPRHPLPPQHVTSGQNICEGQFSGEPIGGHDPQKLLGLDGNALLSGAQQTSGSLQAQHRNVKAHHLLRPNCGRATLFYREKNMPAQSHRSDPHILARRTLQRDHGCLAELLRPGLSVLDVGCGTGAITAGVAKAVGPHGHVVGIDRDEVLLELARTEHTMLPNLEFERSDVTTLTFCAQFDIVTAARTLQWVAEPALAISKMKRAAKPSGLLVVLDYNHTSNEWEPDPPGEFKLFYNAFLAWRSTNGWDNEMADHLPDLFRSAGLLEVKSHMQDEVVEHGAPDFAERTTLWSEVIESLGGNLVTAGFHTKHQLEEARECYDSWAETALVKQTLAMRAVTGKVP
jgi:SAM-dependent methyltransferase